MNGTTTAETLALVKDALAAGGIDTMAKTITTGTGLVAYDLQAPAKNLGAVGVAAVQHQVATIVAGDSAAAAPLAAPSS